MDPSSPNLLRLTADIVSAQAAGQKLREDELLSLIRSVYTAFGQLGAEPAEAAEISREPAVPIKKSVFPDHIICLEDGKKLKMLKRHLATAYNMTVDKYRTKWGLPASYPMVAPNYAERRSALAKQIGLGRKPGAASSEPVINKVAEGVSSLKRRKRAAA